MSEIRKLDKPPIKEAVIEFQFQPLIDFEKDELIELYNHVKDNYNEQKFLEQREIKFDLTKDLPPEVGNEKSTYLIGTIFRDDIRGFIVQFKRDRLAVSKLKSYNSFEELEDESFKFYKLIEKFIKDKNISRIGVRFINEINYPKDYSILFDEDPLNNYNTSIGGIQRFYNQSIFEHSKVESTALNLVLDIKQKQVIIDIDSYQIKSQQVSNVDDIKNVLLRLRERKNSIFFKIISKKIEEVL